MQDYKKVAYKAFSLKIKALLIFK